MVPCWGGNSIRVFLWCHAGVLTVLGGGTVLGCSCGAMLGW